jgi:hypothetical protein
LEKIQFSGIVIQVVEIGKTMERSKSLGSIWLESVGKGQQAGPRINILEYKASNLVPR